MRLCQRRINSIRSFSNNEYSSDGKEKIQKLKTEVQLKIVELEEQLKTAEENLKLELRTRIKELKAAIEELNTLEETITNYNFKINKLAPQLNYDNNSDTVTIQNDGTIGSLLNELKHAFQFEMGRIDYIQTKTEDGSVYTMPGVLYDINDEVETYKRQFAMMGF